MNLTELSIKTKEWLIDLLWPKKCLGCGREGLYICKDCETFLSEVEPTIAGGRTSPVILGEVRPQNIVVPNIVSVWEYEGLMEKLIQKIKYDGCYDIINELVEMAFKKIDLNLPKGTIITFVPMYKKKEKYRGFNQAEIIAKKVGQLLSLAEQPLLKKVRNNRSQVGLNPQQRAENVKGVFKMLEAGPRTIKYRSILVVDDVYTTGATMNECMRVLKRAGVERVWGFTLARKLSI